MEVAKGRFEAIRTNIYGKDVQGPDGQQVHQPGAIDQYYDLGQKMYGLSKEEIMYPEELTYDEVKMNAGDRGQAEILSDDIGSLEKAWTDSPVGGVVQPLVNDFVNEGLQGAEDFTVYVMDKILGADGSIDAGVVMNTLPDNPRMNPGLYTSVKEKVNKARETYGADSIKILPARWPGNEARLVYVQEDGSFEEIKDADGRSYLTIQEQQNLQFATNEAVKDIEDLAKEVDGTW